MAFAAVGALFAGGAVTAATVLSAVATIGTTLSVVGMVTGSKSLMKLGGMLGLVGGIGGMIAGAAGGAAAGAAASAAEGAGSAAGFVGEGAASGVGAWDGALGAASSGAESAAGGIIQSTMGGPPAGVGPDLASGSVMPDLAANPTDMRLAAGTQTSPGMMEVGAQGGGTQFSNLGGGEAPTGAQGPATPAETPNPTDMRLEAGTQQSPYGPSQDSGSFWSSFSQFADKNKTLFNSGMQVVGGAMKGANERDMWNQKMALHRDQFNRANSYGQFAPGIIQGARA